MNENEYTLPPIPYWIRVQTSSFDFVWIKWEETLWDEPAAVTFEAEVLKDSATELQEFLHRNSTGFQGYAIEDMDRPSPQDINAILCKFRGTAPVLDFVVIGPIPDGHAD